MAWLKGLAAMAAVAAAAAGVMFYHLFNLPNERGTEVQLLIEKGAEGGQFISREEFVKRTRANSAVMEKLDALGCLNDLPDSDQVSMF